MQLQQYLETHGISIPAFASKIGVSEQAVYRYLGGDRTPRREVMQRIAAETAGVVQPNDFYGQVEA